MGYSVPAEVKWLLQGQSTSVWGSSFPWPFLGTDSLYPRCARGEMSMDPELTGGQWWRSVVMLSHSASSNRALSSHSHPGLRYGWKLRKKVKIFELSFQIEHESQCNSLGFGTH